MCCRAGKHICKTGKSLTEWGYVINTAILASINKPAYQMKTNFFKEAILPPHTIWAFITKALETTSASKFICTEVHGPHHRQCCESC